jgi:hypothetical protein
MAHIQTCTSIPRCLQLTSLHIQSSLAPLETVRVDVGTGHYLRASPAAVVN